MSTKTKLVPPLRCYGHCLVTKATNGHQGNFRYQHQPQVIRSTLRVSEDRHLEEILHWMISHSRKLVVDVRSLPLYDVIVNYAMY